MSKYKKETFTEFDKTSKQSFFGKDNQ